jgi:hypothetical protein
MPVNTIMMALSISETNTMLNGAGQLPISITRNPWSMVERSNHTLAARSNAVANTAIMR